MMRSLADRFVCLPGSYGTLDEMMDVTASGTVNEHHKPMFVLNYKGFYDPLKLQVEKMKALNFIPQTENYKFTFVDSVEELFMNLTNI